MNIFEINRLAKIFGSCKRGNAHSQNQAVLGLLPSFVVRDLLEYSQLIFTGRLLGLAKKAKLLVSTDYLVNFNNIIINVSLSFFKAFRYL